MNIIYICMTQDGFISGLGDDISFLDSFNDVDYGYDEFYSTVDKVVMGYSTYDVVKNMPFEYPYKNIKNYIITSKNLPNEENIIFTKFDKDLFLPKKENLWIVGGGKINKLFFQNNLIDKMIVFVVPVKLGNGIGIFDDIPFENVACEFNLKESLTYKNKARKLVYEI